MSVKKDKNPPSAFTNLIAFGILATGAGGVCLAVYLVAGGLGMIVNKLNPPPEAPASRTLCYKASYVSSYSSRMSPFYHIILKDKSGSEQDFPISSTNLTKIRSNTNMQVQVEFGLDPVRNVIIQDISLTARPTSCE
jgi:hypothetical protein